MYVVKKILKFKKIYILLIILSAFVFVTCSKSTYSEEILDNGVQVEPNTELTYYLDIYYDGVDKYNVQSSDSQMAEITSNEITITDKLPTGLVFQRFIGNSGDQIGAVLRSDPNVGCLGYVVNGYNGLSFDLATNTVSFKIKNMQAGCKITVGIVTKTPSTVDDPSTVGVVETRRDFYNTADGSEGEQSIRSNTVHVWMGQEGGSFYMVKYQYDGSEPVNAPALPSEAEFEKYTANSIVNVAAPINMEGYNFEWVTSDVTVTNGKFTMPAKVVTFTGKFTRKPAKNVIYQLTSTDNPSEYVLPGNNGIKEQYVDSIVTVDSLKAGDVIGGYRFSGWTTNDVTVTDGTFKMPNADVTFTGSFEKIKYTVSYQFQGSILPPNSSQYLPANQSYAPGETVTVSQINPNVVGYEFVGWYSEPTFIMPEENVVISGEWVIRYGYFKPTIKTTITSTCNFQFDPNATCYLTPATTAYSQTIVTNTADIPIKNVVVKVNGDESSVLSNVIYTGTNNGYTKIDKNTYEITQLNAGQSVTIRFYHYGYYGGTFDVNSEIIGALADNNYVLDETGNYKDTATYHRKASLKICSVFNGKSRGSRNQYIIESDNFYTTLITKDNSCGKIFLEPGEYTITQVGKQDYGLVSVTGDLTTNGGKLIIPNEPSDDDYRIDFKNEIINDKWYRSWDRNADKYSVYHSINYRY